MKKIVFVTGSMGRGGAERVISLLSGHYCARGWDVSILMLLHSAVKYTLDERVKIVDLSNDKRRAVLDMPRLIREVRRYAAENRPDVMVCFMAQNCIICDLACHGLGTRMVLSERIDPASVKRNPVYRLLLERAYARSAVTVLQTQRAFRYFPERVQRNSVIIPNPISVRTQAAATSRPRIVTAGRLVRQKNHRMLIDAFAALHEKHPEYTLDIYGDGPLHGELQAQIDALRLAEAVRLPGNVPDVHEQMADAEMFVLPSDFEGLSNALLEAMMMGLPCIATSCAGCDEAIADGVNGLLIPVGDTQALTAAMLRLAEDAQARRRMGEKAREASAAYEVDAVIGQWRQAIEG